ncbi:type II toxin-antitoxin system death-on-curing family toxin [Luteimonas sp. S4-F44]|uniref:type II toxin-antitoxin system death-on-curing family toxin n=1 Tax=Luteimonas sp. S4-F44 TaxID=2925842 RepID=UPI001F539F64|nr:type II toxin-antitoxin system death-on-curing family toxin [Luteimonas sp. S4-F44]UNK44056.1 type II toxin-antitoxin system death-on-curing family toxin [Luteimonas sp. S4-F44]
MHEDQLAEHGGGVGLRDPGFLDTALAKPQQCLAYGAPPPDLAALAATYAHGIARLHPFIDGNNRTSLVAAETFIDLHGHRLDASDADCVQIWLQVASGDLDDTALAAWIRARLRPVDA